MVTHLSTVKAYGCLTLLILPFTLTALTFGSCLCCALIEAFNLGILLSLCEKVKVQGWMSSVKQPLAFTVLRWVTIWRLLFFLNFTDFTK